MLSAISRNLGKILLVLALACVVLGVAGFLSFDPDGGFMTPLYRTIQLFGWDYTPWDTTRETNMPWSLAVARWVAPITMLTALSRLTIRLFQQRWNAFRARLLRGHVVVCGAGDKGCGLADELRRVGSESVLLVERDTERAEALTAAGVLVIPGDATGTGVLRRAAVQHASRVVITTGDDLKNLAIAMTAAHLGIGNQKLVIYALISNDSLCDLYQRSRAMAASLRGIARVRFFNHYRNVARRTIHDFPPESAEGEVHVVLPGLSGPGRALAVEYALTGHFSGDRRVNLHVVGPTASAELAMLRNRYPSIDHCTVIEAVDLASDELFCQRVAALVADTEATARFTIFPSFEAEHHAFVRALELLELTRRRPAMRLLLPGQSGAPIRALVEANPTLRGHIAFLPRAGESGGYEAIFGEALDRTAREIHEDWLQETQRQIEAARASGDEARARSHEAKTTFKPWDDLNEEQKGASRSEADHIPFKIRAAGLDPRTVTGADWAQLSAGQIEMLARMEHARWAASCRMTGWTFARQRDDDLKQHPDLVAFDELDDPTREYDREAVRNLGRVISRKGQKSSPAA